MTFVVLGDKVAHSVQELIDLVGAEAIVVHDHYLPHLDSVLQAGDDNWHYYVDIDRTAEKAGLEIVGDSMYGFEIGHGLGREPRHVLRRRELMVMPSVMRHETARYIANPVGPTHSNRVLGHTRQRGYRTDWNRLDPQGKGLRFGVGPDRYGHSLTLGPRKRPAWMKSTSMKSITWGVRMADIDHLPPWKKKQAIPALYKRIRFDPMLPLKTLLGMQGTPRRHRGVARL